MGGAVIASKTLVERMKRDFILLGGVLDPHAAFLIQRGLKTYFVRYRAQCVSALRVAELLARNSAVENVRYPGLASHAQHALAATQMSEFGAIVTFDLKAGAEAGRRFAEALQLFAITASLGATDSLVIPPQLIGGREFNAEQRRASGISDGTVRLSIGLEDPEDLLADIAQALELAGRGTAATE
jgi:cystathionine beta-lyase/cystathionine gamma-synthase